MAKLTHKTLQAKRLDESKLDALQDAARVHPPTKSHRPRGVKIDAAHASERIARALRENPLFQQRLAHLVESTVAAVEKLLGDTNARPKRAPRHLASRFPSSKISGQQAVQMVAELIEFLRETTNQAIAAGLFLDSQGSLKIDAATETRRQLQKRQEGFRDSRDTSIYPLDPFYRDDVLRKWR